MKKWTRLLAVGLLAAFTVFLLIRRFEPPGGADSIATDEDPRKQQIRQFWDLNRQANQLRLAGDFPAAASLYRQCLEINPKHEDSLYYLGVTLEELGDYREAAAVFQKMAAFNPSSSRAFSQLGSVLSLRAPGSPLDFEAAEKAFSRKVELNPEHAGPSLNLGFLHLDQASFPAALDHFRTAAQYGSPEGNFLAGYTLFLQGNRPDAITFFENVLAGYEHDRKVAAHGAVLEGNVLPAPDAPLTAQQRSAIQSMLYLDWATGGKAGKAAQVSPRLPDKNAPKLRWRDITSPMGLDPRAGRAAWADFDRDGRLDLVAGGQGRPLRLYRHGGKQFAEVTAAAGLRAVRDVWDACWGDYDADGYPDLYLVRPGFVGNGQNQLFHNSRDGTFSDVTAGLGLAGVRSTARAFFLDLDRDGRLDLVEAGASADKSGSLRIFHNRGERFEETAQAWGLHSEAAAVDAAAGDYDGDGAPDLFVHYWRRNAVLYRSQAPGRFADVTEQAGLAAIRGLGFSSLFFDYDLDGSPDLLVTAHASSEDVVRQLLDPKFRPATAALRLFRNNGRGGFDDVTEQAGLTGSYGVMQALAADLDQDGFPDLVLATGSLDAERLEPSVILRNNSGKGFSFWSYLPAFNQPRNLIGVSAADVNDDGRPELFLTQNPLFPETSFPGGLFAAQ